MDDNTIPKWMVCENPMADKAQGREYTEYILHTKYPMFLAKVTPLLDGSYDIRPVHWFENPPADNPLKLAGLMRRMGDWFHAYCQWEEENFPIDEDFEY